MTEIKTVDEVIKAQENASVDEEKITYREIKDPYGFIYITTNLVNGKRYLGQRMFNKGWEKYLGSGTIFKNAVNKYGKENFHRNIILICYSEYELNKSEYELSIFLNVVESNDWYNLQYGGYGSSGHTHTDESKKKMSESHKKLWEDEEYRNDRIEKYKSVWKNKDYREYQRQINIERCKNPEVRKQLSYIAKEAWEDEEYRQKQHKINVARWQDEEYRSKFTGENSHFYGKTLPEWHKEKLKKSCSGINNKHYHPIFCIELNEIFWGARYANQKYGFGESNITACCKGKIKTAYAHPETGERLHWMYIEDAVACEYITQQQLDEYLNNLKEKENDK